MNRLFTFGCSMTNYHYPTWADILGTTFDYYENWGRYGSGNQFIFNSIIECDRRNNFTSNDTILILWTGIARIDYYQFNEWCNKQSLFPDKSNNEFNDWPISSPDGYEILSYAHIEAIHNILSLKKLNYRSMAWQTYDTDLQGVYKDTLANVEYVKFRENNQQYVDSKSYNLEAEKLYKRMAGEDWPSLNDVLSDNYHNIDDAFILEEIKEFFGYLKSNKKLMLSLANTIDRHPTPIAHLEMVNKYFPHIQISEDTQRWIKDVDYKLIHGIEYQFIASSPKRY